MATAGRRVSESESSEGSSSSDDSLLTAYMSTQREVLEGQTPPSEASQLRKGARGYTPGKFQKPTLQMVQSMLFLSYIL